MTYMSLDIRVGLVAIRAVSEQRVTFHGEVMKLLKPTEQVKRIGAVNSIPIEFKTSVHSPGTLEQRLLAEVNDRQFRYCIIDFSANVFALVRDALLYSLANAIDKLVRGKHCPHFYILIQSLPAETSLFVEELVHVADKHKTSMFGVSVIANNGDTLSIEAPQNKPVKTHIDGYAQLIQADSNSQSRIDRKCVRVVGHFPRRALGGTVERCGKYSYQYVDCQQDILSLLTQWWEKYAKDERVFLYDLRASSEFRRAAQAFSVEHNIEGRRITEAIEDKELRERIKKIGRCVLIVDAVSSGNTFVNFADRLLKVGINIHTNALAGVVKGATSPITLAERHKIHGLVYRDKEPEPIECPHCTLGLKHDVDGVDLYRRIRTFDLLWMADEAGWGVEPPEEVPPDGKQYPTLPNFGKMIDDWGDFIGYKAFQMLRSTHLAENVFVVHPDEADSSAFAARLIPLFGDQLCLIRVPRPAITMAQDSSNDWGKVIPSLEHERWVTLLRSIQNASGIILDIFNASGGTCNSLHALLKYFGLQACGYLCLVDFNPDGKGQHSPTIVKHSLYRWMSPRILHAPGESVHAV